MTSDDRPMWFVWSKGIGKPYPSIFYEALPTSHDGKRNIISEPRPLMGEDRELSLEILAIKYPLVKGTEK